MSESKVQTTHLLAVYLIFLVFGYLMETDLQNEYEEVAETPTSLTGSPTAADGVRTDLWTQRIDSIESSTSGAGSASSYNGSGVRFYDVSRWRGSPARYRVQSTRESELSTDPNAFDELIRLVTEIRCVDGRLSRSQQELARHRCNAQGECKRAVTLRRKMSRLYEARWGGNPLLSVMKSRAVKMEDRLEGACGGAAYHHTITIDANLTFLEEMRHLGSWCSLSLLAELDLSGLNSIHKHEIIGRLLQVVRWTIVGRGYSLVRCSPDGETIRHYLQQEGLQDPLHIRTLWHLHAC